MDVAKEITLSGGAVCLVDDCDFERLSTLKWFPEVDGRTSYAVSGAPHNIRMHRLVLGVSDPLVVVDHRDHNGLNNTRENLRLCSNAQNRYNQRPVSGSSSKFKGVTWHRRGRKWQASIMKQGRSRHLGLFHSEAEAAAAYDTAARELFGEFAYLNEPGNTP